MCTHRARGARALFHLLIFSTLSLSACVDRQLPAVAITEISPAILTPGQEATITGRGFGEPTIAPEEQLVAIAGRPLTVKVWSERRITVTLPATIEGGARILTLSRAGRPIVSVPVYIGAPLTAGDDREVGLPPLNDQGPPRDAGPQEQDMNPTDFGPSLDVQVEYSPQLANAELGLAPRLTRGAEGRLELLIDVTLSPERQAETWGLATHLTYPSDRLAFIEPTQEITYRLNAVSSAQLPGRVMLYRVNPAELVMTLRFEVLDPLDLLVESPPLTLDFVPRFTGIRNLQKEPTNVVWSGGSLRYVRP